VVPQIEQKQQGKEPIPEFLTNGIMLFFLGDHRFLYIQKRYEPNKKLWYQRIKKGSKQINESEPDNYYIHKHKDIIKIDNEVKAVSKEDRNALIPSTNIWIGLLRPPITPGNLKYYYSGKYTSMKGTFEQFMNTYFIGLKSVIVTKTNGNVDKKEDVLVQKWFVYADLPQNQAVFIL
jgi:hypothetical protein